MHRCDGRIREGLPGQERSKQHGAPSVAIGTVLDCMTEVGTQKAQCLLG